MLKLHSAELLALGAAAEETLQVVLADALLLVAVAIGVCLLQYWFAGDIFASNLDDFSSVYLCTVDRPVHMYVDKELICSFQGCDKNIRLDVFSLRIGWH